MSRRYYADQLIIGLACRDAILARLPAVCLVFVVLGVIGLAADFGVWPSQCQWG